MGTTLTGKRVQNTYDSLLKIGDNDNLTGTAKRIGDGLGNDSPIFLSTTKIGIGVTPTYEFQTNSHAKIGGNLIVGGNLTVNGTTTIIDSTVIAIGDNMMEMAKDNVSNTMDIGWYGTINESGEKYVGVFYDASTGVTTPEFHIGLGTVEPSSTASWTTKGKLVIGALDATTGVFSGQVTIPETPSANTDAASKGYVDSAISSGSVEVAKRIEITVKNISGGSLSKGTIVHASPSVSPPSGNVVEVIAADYDDATKMPGIGVLNETVANEAEGAAVMLGAVSGIDTSSFSAGDELFVGNNGAFTNTKPTANNELIQKIAIVLKVHASNGSIKVFGAGRVNDVPNQINRNVNFTDNSKLTFGDSTTPDFQIYHDGNNSYINEDGTGVLAIQSNGTEVQINKGASEYMARFIIDGAVNLYYDNSKKFETTSTGISITGLGQFSNKILVADGSVSAPSYSFTNDTDSGIYHSGTQLKFALGGSDKITISSGETTIEETLFVNDYISADDKVIIEGENAYLQIQDVSQETYTNLYSLDAESVLSYTHGAFSLRTGFFNGTVVFSVDSSRNVTFNNNVLPDVDSANDLGSTSLRWANVWADNINGGTPVNGSGTANDVVMWSDSDTLTDAPIAISGNDATFAGDVTLGDTSSDHRSLSIQTNSEKNSIINLKEGSNLYGFSLGYYGVANDFIIKRHDNSASGTDVLTLNRDDNNATFAGDISLADGSSAYFGDSNDLRIAHIGGNSKIQDSGTGSLVLDTNGASILLTKSDTEFLAKFITDGAVELYHDNSKKFETTSTGVSVTGGATFTGSVGIGAAPANKLHIQQAKSGSSAENYDLLRFNLTGTGAIGDSSSIVWYSTSGTKTAGIEGISGQDNILYGELAFNVRKYTTDSFDEVMRINNRGNVGIGTTTPNAKLDILGASSDQLRLRTAETEEYKIGRNSSTGLLEFYGTQSGYTGYVFGGVNGTRMTIDSSGRVGIGMTPSDYSGYMLQINGTTQAFMTFGNTTTGTGALNGLVIGNDSSGADIYQREAQPLRFHTSNTERARIDSSGQVLIDIAGTTGADLAAGGFAYRNNSSSHLQLSSGVNTDAGFMYFYRKNTAGTSVESTGNISNNGLSLVLNGGGQSNQLVLDSSGNSTFAGSVTANTGSKITSSSADTTFSIETTSGTTIFPVLDFVSSHSSAGARIRVSGTDVISIDKSQNLTFAGTIAVGGATPTTNAIEINGADGTSYVFFKSAVATTGARVGLNGDDLRVFNQQAAGELHLGTNGATKLTINSSGNVGIGTDSPAQKLEVIGNVSLGLSSTTTRTALLANTFGYSTSWKTLTIGSTGTNYQTDAVSLCFNVMLNQNSSGSYTGDGSELFFRNVAYFKTPNSSNNGYLNPLTFNNGNIGISTTSPSYKLQVNGTAYINETLYVNGATTIDDNLYVTNGNAGIGTTSPSEILQTNKNSAGNIVGGYFTNSQANTGAESVSLAFGLNRSGGDFVRQVKAITFGAEQQWQGTPSTVDGYLAFSTVSNETVSEKMRITSAGDILFGTTTKGNDFAYFEAADNNRRILHLGSSSTGAETVVLFRNPNGAVGSVITDGFTTSFGSSSDYRLKENVVEMTDALDRVSNLKPSRFNFIGEEKTVDGFLAHEVQDIVPEAISGKKDAVDEKGNPIYQGIDQSKLVPLLVGAIQELKDEIEILRSQINS